MPYIPNYQREEWQSTPKYTLIAAMWILTAVVLFAAFTGQTGYILTWGLDGTATIIGIVLACSKGSVNKTNGWAKISIELLFFVIGFMAGASRAKGY